MPPQVRVEIYSSLRPHLAEIVGPEMRARAERVLERARQDAPVDTGEWAESIHIEDHEQPGGFRVGSDDDRSISIEYGTSDTPEHATLRHSLDAAKE